jgi:hypothetical protein
MKASTSADFEDLMPNAGFSFEAFGNETQADLDEFKDQRFRGDPKSKFRLQGLWAHHVVFAVFRKVWSIYL